jgi:Hypothetical protein (DUF2513)
MKLDLDLWRNILLQLEAAPLTLDKVVIEGKSEDEIDYHIDMMVQGDPRQIEGYRIEPPKRQTFPKYYSMRLTREGHNVLNQIRNDTLWQRLKPYIHRAGGMISSGMITHLINALPG